MPLILLFAAAALQFAGCSASNECKIESAAVEMADMKEVEDLPEREVPQMFLKIRCKVNHVQLCKGLALHVDGNTIETTTTHTTASSTVELHTPPVTFGTHHVVLSLPSSQSSFNEWSADIFVNCCLPPEEYENFPHLKIAGGVREPDSEFSFAKDVFMGNVPYWTRFLGMHGLLNPNKTVRYLEVGTWEGQSAVWTALAALRNEHSEMTSIDIMQGFYLDRWLTNAGKLGLGSRLQFINDDSFRGLASLVANASPSKFYDLIYIDAAHDARSTLANTLMAWELLKPGGMMIWDDYGLDGDTGPQKAVDVFWLMFADSMSVLKRATWVNWQPIVRRKLAVKMGQRQAI